VILEYKKLENGRLQPVKVYNILISTQHEPGVSNQTIADVINEKVIKKVVPADLLVGAKIVINPSGSFIFGGPEADAGLTGRKIIVDTFSRVVMVKCARASTARQRNQSCPCGGSASVTLVVC
jgi:S-adenosylmethionine synthetase